VSHFNLFVYGTLRREGGAAAQLAGCELVGPGTVGGTLYDIEGRYPAIVLYGDAPVAGEVWRCPADRLLSLDAYEGTDSGLFRRVAVEVSLGDGRQVSGWIYAAGPALSRQLRPERRLVVGDWLAHRRDH
jgi:gamma-glutamylcyclotransferase (GGCT)/AIG2-like uncharacterized protein YtfP